MATRKRHAPASEAGDRRVQFILPDGTLTLDWPGEGDPALPQLQRQVMEWTHIVRNRVRWIDAPGLRAGEDARARGLLEMLGLSEADLRSLGNAGHAIVSLPYTVEEEGWEMRVAPWEVVLPSATRGARKSKLVVTRVLRRARAMPRRESFPRVLFVESAPGILAREWDFADEHKLVKRYTQPHQRFERLESPTRERLAAVAREGWDIIHLAGFDTHQGLELLKDGRADAAPDGYLVAGEPTGVDPIPAAELSRILTGGDAPPALVFCNFWNSAGRIAPLLVAAGAGAAVAFQDSIHDPLAEMFLGNFYRALSACADLETAFEEGWRPLQAQDRRLQATGIVLWTDSAVSASGRRNASPPRMSENVAPLSPSSLTCQQACERIAVTVEPEPQFSYGLLHNNRDLFKSFLIRNLAESAITGVQVWVELHSNDGTYPYRQSFTLDGHTPVLDLSNRIRIALTSQLARTLDELLRTSLFVRVTWGDHEIFQETFPVTMAPVDQWADTDTDRIFLPSFVFPRDRATGTIIKNAEHFVTALRDDPTAGFDGYQALDFNRTNPAEDVDRQVQALWYSVIYRVPASYINPPPTYAIASQRIRPPTEIVAGGFGTCIDLALMFAACLEAIEVHPVVFLLEDHAFPGYWRTDRARNAFCRRVASMATRDHTTDKAITGAGASAKKRAGAGWCFDQAVFDEIRRALELNQLVALESIGLTSRSSFMAAIEDARTYFDPEQAKHFLMMLDVRTAREAGVTPLPLGPRLQEPLRRD